MTGSDNPFGARTTLTVNGSNYNYYRLDALAKAGIANLDRLPMTIKILLENLLRQSDGGVASTDDIALLARWGTRPGSDKEFPFLPARVVLQDFTGVPAVVDLAAMRSAVASLGRDPQRINPLVPVDLVIDHSVQVDLYGSSLAFAANVEREYERNLERYGLLRWAQQAFRNFRVVPPGTGIVHQVNLEYLASVVFTADRNGERLAYPDTLVGTDSHTTMINGLGVLGWGVGGIEAEAVLLGQPIYLLSPEVIGFRFTGDLPEGVTATDLVLTVTQILRKHGVVGKFVEYFGPGLQHLSLADRATIGNMAPEYGATAGLFPVDSKTLDYLRMTGRSDDLIALVERYSKEQGLFRTDGGPEPTFSETLELDLSTLVPSVAGPKRPQDRVALGDVPASLRGGYPAAFGGSNGAPSGGTAKPQAGGAAGSAPATVSVGDVQSQIGHGSVVIAAITSCTNTSNPSVMIGAGLIAKKAVERGLSVKPHVKTSLAPGSQVVTDYLKNAGVLPYLEALRFHVVGYGCTTCIGNSGPLPDPVAEAVQTGDLVAVSVLSGNRNFEGRIHPQVRASYLASPPLVVAYALAGTVDIDLTNEPLGHDGNGQPVYLRDIWPSNDEIEATVAASVRPEDFRAAYASVFAGDERWQTLPVPEGDLYEWDAASTYVQHPPYFVDLAPQPVPVADIVDARALAVLGDSVTTDHISPAGTIALKSPAGSYLIEHGVEQRDFNSYGARRGNHEVMVRGTFANIRLRNALAGGREGNWTEHLPSGELMSIYDAAVQYIASGTPLVLLAGKEYGSGSSRDWAAKGPMLQGVRAAIAESYERIHRSNLIGMGILPLQFKPGESVESLGLNGRESFTIEGLASLSPRKVVEVLVRAEDGTERTIEAITRIDNGVELDYYRHGGILPMVLRQLVEEEV